VKLLRVGKRNAERPALLDAQSNIRDLSAVIEDITPDWLANGGIATLFGIDVTALPLLPNNVRIGSPVSRVGKIVCVGLNYRDHAAETGQEVPKEPILFLKGGHTVQGPDDEVHIPRGSEKSDWEVELGVVIGRRALNVPAGLELDYIAGYCVCNDLSERLSDGARWTMGQGKELRHVRPRGAMASDCR